MSSVFYSLSSHMLLEINFDQIGINNISFPLEAISDGNSNSTTIVNTKNGTLITNNVKDTSVVSDGINSKVILDDDTGYYYPSFDSNIVVNQFTPSPVSLNYITVRIHVLSGYNFQDSKGFVSSIYVKDKDGNNVFLLNQSFLNSDINRYKYNLTPKKIGSLYYDKFVEFLIIDYNDIITNGLNDTFFSNKIDFDRKGIVYATLTSIKSIDTTKGYITINDEESKTISFAPKDEFGLLTAFISEHENKYLVYEARYDNNPIENVIFKLNSISGNRYFVIHDLEIYEQRGQSLLLVDNISQPQKTDYDKPKKYRPILSRFADGGMKVKYTVRLFNEVSGDSIIKLAELSILDISAYQDEIGRIQINQLESPIKVFNRLVNTNVIVNNKQKSLSKILVPMYINSLSVILEENFFIKIVPFDNIYKIKIFSSKDGNKSVYVLQPNIVHQLTFTKENGNTIDIKESVDGDRKYGVLTFKISEEKAKNIIANNIIKFHITTESNNIKTVLTSGTSVIDI